MSAQMELLKALAEESRVGDKIEWRLMNPDRRFFIFHWLEENYPPIFPLAIL